ncbi:MAG TPA: hypothetical protein VFO27_07660 [Bryobacteraceae bacterium]|nr:hypothetical protein [Bryobacteraceae bacterium]
MIEAAILADDDDDVFDRRGGLDGINRFNRISGLGRCAEAKNGYLRCIFSPEVEVNLGEV